MFFIMYFREKCYKQYIKITFRGNVLVREDFLSAVKKNELQKINRFWGTLLEKFSHRLILEISKI